MIKRIVVPAVAGAATGLAIIVCAQQPGTPGPGWGQRNGATCAATVDLDASCAPESSPPSADSPLADIKTIADAKSIRAFFTCDAGKTVDATFINGAQSNVRLTLSDGRKLSLTQAMSGSGARYTNGNEAFVFWNKGSTAFVEENGKTTYSGCTSKHKPL